jgi:hypothetical protein
MKRATKLLVVLGLLAMARGAMAQSQSAAQGSDNIVTKYVVELVSNGGQTFQKIGEFSTMDEANLCYKEWCEITEVRYRVSPPRPKSIPAMPLPAPKPPTPGGETTPKSVSLPGTTWVGSETLQGYGRLEFRFVDANRVKMVDAQAEVIGTWYRNGNTVTLSFYNGNCYYAGTINGNQISGRATAGKTSFTWSVSR